MMRRDKFYMFISISGLALGITVFMLMISYVRDDLTWESMHKDGDRICRVIHNQSFEGKGESISVWEPIALGPSLKRDIPEFESVTRVQYWGQLFMNAEGEEPGLYIDNNQIVDPDFFKIFNLPFVYGNPETAFSNKRSIVLEEETSMLLFGDSNPIGRTLFLKDSLAYQVSAVVDIPGEGTHLSFSSLFLVETAAEDFGIQTKWQYNNNTYVYAKLVEGTDIEILSKKIEYFMKGYLADNSTVDASRLSLQPLKDFHLRSTHIKDRQALKGDERKTILFSIVAFLILTLAIINHINLSTARSMQRAKEIGIRKTVGANQKQLIRQLIGESMTLVIPAALLSIILIESLKPYFFELVGRETSIDILGGSIYTLILLGLIPLIGFLSGLYPAFVISSLRPVSILGSSTIGGYTKSRLRRILVVFQFSVSVVIVITTILIYQQIRYAIALDPGYNRDQVWVIPLYEIYIQKAAPELRDRIALIEGVSSVTNCSDYLIGPTSSWSMKPEGTDFENYVVNVYSMDQDGDDVYGLKLTEGRFLSNDFPSDPISYGDDVGSIVISESTAKDLGWENPIGKTFDIWGQWEVTVVGVVKDIQFESARSQKGPVVFLHHLSYWNNHFISVRLKGGSIHKTIEEIENIWAEEYPERPISSFFADDKIESQYKSDTQLGNTLLVLSMITFFIAFLGLLGLSVHATERRNREIAIRKVLGASIQNINLLLVSEFAGLIFIANLIAWPIAWWLSNSWLNDFAYRITISPSVYIFVGFVTLSLTFAIISLQAWRTIKRNPSEVIRHQ
jgi:putative ABC transport system permease protein